MSWNRYSSFSYSLITILALFSACATPRFMPLSTPESRISPNGEILTVEKAGLIVNARHIETPYSLRRITTFEITLVNPNDREVDFYPKEFLLWDQNNRQYSALRSEALTEAALAGVSYAPAFQWGFGYGYYHHYHDPWRWGFYGYDPYPYRSYEGLIAKALPMKPIAIFPRATVTGNVYFPVSAGRLRSVQLAILRFDGPPREIQNLPPEISYIFEFAVIQ